jgi:hypothetical protein
MKRYVIYISSVTLILIVGLASCQKEGVATPSSTTSSIPQHSGASFKNGNGYEYLVYIPNAKKFIGGNSWVLDSSGGYPSVTLTDSLDQYDSTDVKSLTLETGTSYTPPLTPCATTTVLGIHVSVYCGTPHTELNGSSVSFTCTGGSGFCFMVASPIYGGTHYTGRIQPNL